MSSSNFTRPKEPTMPRRPSALVTTAETVDANTATTTADKPRRRRAAAGEGAAPRRSRATRVRAAKPPSADEAVAAGEPGVTQQGGRPDTALMLTRPQAGSAVMADDAPGANVASQGGTEPEVSDADALAIEQVIASSQAPEGNSASSAAEGEGMGASVRKLALEAANARHSPSCRDPKHQPLSEDQVDEILGYLGGAGPEGGLASETLGYLERGMSLAHARVQIRKLERARTAA